MGALGLLGRAKTMVRGWVAAPPAAPVSFNVACANGHRLRGHRTEGYQALRCPSCGEAVFVLPRSPLPEPPAPPAAKRARGQSTGEAVSWADDAPHALTDHPAWSTGPDTAGLAPQPGTSPTEGADLPEIDWVDEVEPGPPAPRGVGLAPKGQPARPAPASPPVASPRPAAVAPMAPATTPVPEHVAPPRTWGERVVAHRNALLVAAVVLVAVSAVALRRHRQRLDEFPRLVEIGRTEGIQKLDAGDFFAAKTLLAEAAAAVDGLGSHDEVAANIHQAAREAALLNDLVPATLEELVEEGHSFAEPAGWSSHFRSKYQGRSIVIETTITAVPDPAKPKTRFEDAYRIVVGQGTKPQAQGRIGYDGFRLFEVAPPKVGETKILGARLASLDFDLAEGVWVLTLEPESGAYITHTAALPALHWPAGEPIEDPRP